MFSSLILTLQKIIQLKNGNESLIDHSDYSFIGIIGRGELKGGGCQNDERSYFKLR